jgi:2-phospho-L-lactate guanylyltransferase (CobY/MobA/RfbA family)
VDQVLSLSNGSKVLMEVRMDQLDGAGATTAAYTPSSAVPGTTYYRVLVNAANNGCDQAVSDNAVAVITADLVISTQPSNINECVGGTDQMTVTVTGGSGTITYQWQESADGSTGWANSTGTGATTATYTPSSATPGTTYYRVLVNAVNSGCDQAVSNNAVVVISADLAVSTQPTDVNECVGGTDQMTVAVTGGSGTITYQWQQSANGSTDGQMQQEQVQLRQYLHHRAQQPELLTIEY